MSLDLGSLEKEIQREQFFLVVEMGEVETCDYHKYGGSFQHGHRSDTPQ